MSKRSILLVLSVFVICVLGAQTFEWGVKYQGGVSKLMGDDDNYVLRFDLDKSGVDFGYLQAESDPVSMEYAQGAGLYMMKRLSKKVDSLWLQGEILWQRYAFSYDFKDGALDTDHPSAFPDISQGSIYHSADYISFPLLFKMRQEMPKGLGNDQFQGAYLYFGPALSFLIEQNYDNKGGVHELEQNLQGYLDDNPGLRAVRSDYGADVLLVRKFDIVVGTGFQLKDVFKLGLGSDTFSIDLRGDISMVNQGKAEAGKDFRLICGLLSLSYKF